MKRIQLSPITSKDSPFWKPWLEIYDASFPIDEQMTVGFFEKLFANWEKEEEHDHLVYAFVASDNPETVLGITMFELDRDEKSLCIWYIAMDETVRNQGLGAKAYGLLVDMAKDLKFDSLTYEVDIPKTTDPNELARRRIRFYQRQGSKLLGGYSYLQSVDNGSAPIPMWLMVHPLVEISPDEAARLCREVWGETFKPVGEVYYVDNP
ncbi:MAG: GNAT family N-acetyltransferase [Chthonomonadales bacterium]